MTQNAGNCDLMSFCVGVGTDGHGGDNSQSTGKGHNTSSGGKKSDCTVQRIDPQPPPGSLYYPGDKPPVVFARDPAQLIEQVEALRDDARRLANLSREGRAWVRRNHGYDRHLHLLESAYFGERVTESMKRGYKLPPAPAA